MKLKIGKLNMLLFLVFCGFTSLDVAAQNIAKQLGSYNEVKVFNGLRVTLVPSGSSRIEISGHSKDKVTFEIIGDRLEIRTKLNNIWSEDNTEVTLYGETIEVIDVNEGSSVEVMGVLQQDKIILRAQEGASIFAKIEAKKANSKVVTGGRITVVGKVEDQEVEVATGGHFFGEDLKTNKTEVSVTTAGRGEVHATEYCKATASLGGVIAVTGNPGIFDHKTSLGGKIL